MSITVVPITPDHVDGYRAALDVVARERRYLRMDEAPPPEAVRAFVLGNIDAGNPMIVALDDDVVVGWCDITRGSSATSAHRGVLGIGIVPGRRGRGIGQRLIEAALAAARQARFVRVELGVYASNLSAIRLYERVGFIHEGRLEAAMLRDGVLEDLLLMAIVDKTQID